MLLTKRFEELSTQLDDVAATKFAINSDLTGRTEHVDAERLLNWSVKARSLIATACGSESEHYRSFVVAEKLGGYETNLTVLKRVRAVFLAAKEDFEGGYLRSVRALVQAEIAGGELEQARELLRSGYLLAAAVVCGVVLENALRELCDRQRLPHGTGDRMNAELAKAGKYNGLVQKRVLSLLAIRNSAAHGKVGEFSSDDVRVMISDVERFVTDSSLSAP